MDQKSSILSKLVTIGIVGALAVGAGMLIDPETMHELRVDHRQTFGRVVRAYSKAIHSFQNKADALMESELANERLRLENTHLRLKLEGIQFDCSARDAVAKTRNIEYKLDKETGSATGRELGSIQYTVPTHLLPEQAYTLGISYFKAREDDKAAVIFTFLTGMHENDHFKTARNYLLTGVSWYRLENYKLADRYFDKVLQTPTTWESQASQAHARLWKALIAERFGKHTKAQFWLTEYIDHHPHSTEAEWINTNGGARGVASSKE